MNHNTITYNRQPFQVQQISVLHLKSYCDISFLDVHHLMRYKVVYDWCPELLFFLTYFE